METLALITTALTMATPYLVKTGESIAEKIGEDIWSIIKKPFSNGSSSALPETIETDRQLIIDTIIAEAEINPDYLNQIRGAVEKAEKELSAYQQNINNNAEIGKQINIQNNSGSISM